MWFNQGGGSGGLWGRGPAQAQVPAHPAQGFAQGHHAHAVAMQQAHYNALAQHNAAAAAAAAQQQQNQPPQAYYVQAQGQGLDTEETESALQTSVTDPMSTAGGDGFNAADLFSAFRGFLKDAGIVQSTSLTTVNSSVMESGLDTVYAGHAAAASSSDAKAPPKAAPAPPPQKPFFPQPAAQPPPSGPVKLEEGSTEELDPRIRQSLREAIESRHVGRLQAALQEARSHGMRHGPEVSNAREMLLHIEAAAAQERAALHAEEAMRSDDNWKMQAALSHLLACGGGPLLEPLKKAMQDHNRRKDVINGLRSAQAARDTVRLKTAIESALKIHLEDSYIREAGQVLSKIEEQEIHRQQLQQAVASKSLSTIRPAYQKAEKVLDPKFREDREALEAARNEMSDLAKVKLWGHLQVEDTQRLDEALREASNFFVDKETIDDLQRRSAALKEQIKQRTALQNAVTSKDVDKIAAALKAAKAADVPAEHLEAAERELRQHRETAQREVKRGAAAKELARARKEQEPEQLRRALADAEAAGLGGIDIVAANEEYKALAAKSSSQRELHAAMQSGDVYRLKAAIVTATSSQMDKAAIDDAKAKLEALKEQALARRKLDTAVASGEAHEIEQALLEAKRVGLQPNETSKAQSALSSRKGLDVGAKLRNAMKSDDVEELRQLANSATHAGVPRAEVDAAWSRIRHLDSLSWQRKELQAAIDSEDCARLKASIRHAEDVGVPASEMSEAKSKLDRLIQRRTAEQELTMARASGNSESLRKAIERAHAAEVSPTLVNAAETDLDSVNAVPGTSSNASSTTLVDRPSRQTPTFSQVETFGSVQSEAFPADEIVSAHVEGHSGYDDAGALMAEPHESERPSVRQQKKVTFESGIV